MKMEKILVVVDMQKDFIDGALGTGEAVGIVDNVAAKIREFEGRILITKDTHKDDYLMTQEGKNLPVMHCIEGTEGWMLYPQIQAALEEKKQGYEIFEKPAFGSRRLAERLMEIRQETEIEEIQFVGLCTDICVISNVMLAKAFLPETPVSVWQDCCAGVTPESHANALAAMKICQVTVK